MNQIAQQFQMAKQAYASGDFSQAVRICDQLTIRTGARDDLLNIKAVSLLALGQAETARTSIQQAIKLNPRIAGLQLNAAGIYKALCLIKQAKRHAVEAVRLAPRDATILYQAALLLRDFGDYPQALRVIDRCLQLQPDFSLAWHLKGAAMMDLGNTEAAQHALEKAVALEPGNARALSALVKLRRDGLEDVETVALLKNIQSSGANPRDRASAAFSLGNMHHREGQYERAFALYHNANTLAATVRPFDFGHWQQNLEQGMQASSKPGALSATPGSSTTQLAFIIGMPRSGTSLCEQVLSAHPAVLACGELATIEQIEGSFTRRGSDPYQVDPDAKEFQQASELYLSAMPKNHQQYQWVTDKAPLNFKYVGLIHRLFPQARFLYCTRHPLDTILSCYIQDFHAGLEFTFDLEKLTKVYIAHAQMMRHWLKLLPAQIHTVNYEQFIENQQTETMEMAEFLQLGFVEEMLSPHLQERAVTTASNLQVRQAVYKSSVGRWKNYQQQLAAVITLLQQHKLLDENLNCLH